jgi:TM2 domain-containing membrane protein YozV
MSTVPGAEKKIAAGVCGILLGWLGVHKFILGYTTEGILLLSVFFGLILLSLLTCGITSFLIGIPGIIGLIEGILYLTKTDEEFAEVYVRNKRPWF